MDELLIQLARMYQVSIPTETVRLVGLSLWRIEVTGEKSITDVIDEFHKLK